VRCDHIETIQQIGQLGPSVGVDDPDDDFPTLALEA
jgi:hypothetical protein